MRIKKEKEETRADRTCFSSTMRGPIAAMATVAANASTDASTTAAARPPRTDFPSMDAMTVQKEFFLVFFFH